MTPDEVFAALYSFPSLTDSTGAYGLGFALVLVPWLVSLATAKVLQAIRIGFYNGE